MNQAELQPVVAPWPAEELEHVGECPVCGEVGRSLLHDKLVDRVFFTAPGEWTVWRCERCRSAYLDPRPTPGSIGIAYDAYYTHDEEPTHEPESFFRRVRTALANGYRNRRFGTNRRPAIAAGYLLGQLLPRLASPLKAEFRHLPLPPRAGARLLDVGCGGGDWLKRARQAGWSVFGADPDSVARERGAKLGIEIRAGGAESFLNEPGSFDAITTNHSLEHVHDPNRMLRDMFTVLRPGGWLFVETPNIDSYGYDLYQRTWLGLDPPRHLVLFNRDSLKGALQRAGFTNIRQHRRPEMFPAIARYSALVAAGHRFNAPGAPDVTIPGPLMQWRANFSRRKAEALVFTAERPA